MKLAASNIGWSAGSDDEVMHYMTDRGFTGLEIAPTRLFPDSPYDSIALASDFAEKVKTEYGFSICSMQSIWYGMRQRIIDSETSRNELFAYTEKALRFAEAVGCSNLVFGCPRNRSYDDFYDIPVLEEFLHRCAEKAAEYGAVIALEANPPIYHTNFINTTLQALETIKKIDHPSLKLNLDFGTVIENSESFDCISEDVNLISHVHISEPNLVQIKQRAEHRELMQLLADATYQGYISIEMGSQGNILDAIDYLSSIVEQLT